VVGGGGGGGGGGTYTSERGGGGSDRVRTLCNENLHALSLPGIRTK